MRVEEVCPRSLISTAFNNPVLSKLTKTICASTLPPSLWKNGIHIPGMTKARRELVAKKPLKKLTLKFCLNPKLATDSKILFMLLTEYTMKSERSIETRWFRSSTYITSTSHPSGPLITVTGQQAVMSSTLSSSMMMWIFITMCLTTILKTSIFKVKGTLLLDSMT